MSAETLRRAADLLDEVAGEATPGPWEHVRSPFRETAGHSLKRDDHVLALVGWEREEPDRAPSDAAHIARMSPEVGKALAVLLRVIARWERWLRHGGLEGVVEDAASLARAILREGGE